MPRIAKEHRSVSFKLQKSIVDTLDDFVEQTRMTKTAAMECALQDYFKKCEASGFYQPNIEQS